MSASLNLRSPAVLTVIGVIVTLVLAVAVVMALLRTGGTKAVSDNAALIGALVALGGVLTAQMVSIALDDRRTQESRNLEERRTQEARSIEAARADEAALQNYFEKVGTLLIEQPLLQASPGDNLSTVVRAQTLAVLEGLEPERKRILILFLYESGLILKDKPVVILALANLAEADLQRVNLRGADLSGADISNANLIGADLSGGILMGAILREAVLRTANLSKADLSDADLGPSVEHKVKYLVHSTMKGA